MRRRPESMYRVPPAVSLVLIVVFILTSSQASGLEGSKFREAVRSDGGVIASESPDASRIGLEVLDGGGNAVDAAVAATFALGVSRPQSCGIGGGGFMIYRGADGEAAALDFREAAPEAIEPDAFAGSGIYAAFTGHKTVGVPGIVAGMQEALDAYGTLTLAEAVAPAERLARDGFEVSEPLSNEMGNNAERLKLFPEAAGQFLVGGEKPYEPGSTLTQSQLADTLALISREGPEAFYEGAIADRVLADMQEAGDYPGDEGLLTEEDLAVYRAVWREPLTGDYRGTEIIAMPPPTSGGVAVIEMLNILEGHDLEAKGQSSVDALHHIAEAQKLAFADREEYVADPDFVDVPTERLINKAYAEERRAEIDAQKAGSYGPGAPSGNPESSTTHLSIIDAAGNAVSLTCTIEQPFGSAVVAPGTGFLLNNELTDFSGPGTPNEPEPGKRPRSSISPTIVVEDGKPVLVVGGAGGARIIMGTLFAIINTVDFGLDPARAVDAERLDQQPNSKMALEDGRISPTVQGELKGRGHKIERKGEYEERPRVQAAGIDRDTGERLAATDPRSGEQASAGQGVRALPQTGGVPLPATGS
jgi:gamma-glutamyltranspeptidase / glutathione hydrolase